MEDAELHCTRGIGIWDWASNDDLGEPDVVMACAGDVPTMEILAAVRCCATHLPDLAVRVVNVVDLMRLATRYRAPHGLSDRDYDALFTIDKPVIFAYHGYPWLIHRLAYRRAGRREPARTRLQGRGHGHDAVRHARAQRHGPIPSRDGRDRPGAAVSASRAAHVRQHMVDERTRHQQYTRAHGEDLPEVRDWKWTNRVNRPP